MMKCTPAYVFHVDCASSRDKKGLREQGRRAAGPAVGRGGGEGVRKKVVKLQLEALEGCLEQAVVNSKGSCRGSTDGGTLVAGRHEGEN